MIVMTLRRLNQYSSFSESLAKMLMAYEANALTSPYARTVMMLAHTRTTQKINPRAQAGKSVFQYSNTN